MTLINILIAMYIIAWISFIIGVIFIKSHTFIAKKFERFIWNSRIEKMQLNPFKMIFKLYEQKNYIFILLLIILINSSMVLVQFISGFIFLSFILIIYQGFFIGSLIAQADKKTVIFSLIVLIFELGAFAFSGGLGIYIGIEWIINKKIFMEIIIENIKSGYIFIPIICLLLNGIIEASGIFFGIEGVPGVKAVKEKLYK